MFAQKFSRNKVELRVRCLPRPLCHFPSPLCLCSAERLFQLCSPFLAEFVSARSRRKPLEKWKNSGKKTYYKPFCILFRFLLDPDLDTVSQPNPPSPQKKHHLATPLATLLPTAVMRFHFTVTGSVHGKVSAFITEF